MLNPNKTMSRRDLYNPEIAKIINDIQIFMFKMKKRDLQYTSWVGTFGGAHIPTTVLNKGKNYIPYEQSIDDNNIPWFTLWEYCWILANSGLLESKPVNVLEFGGAASAFSMFIASLGHHITVIEKRDTINTAVKNAKALNLENNFEGIRDDVKRVGILVKERVFDCFVSISHLFLISEEARKAVLDSIPKLSRIGSKMCLSFDYLNPNPLRFVNDPIKHFAIEGFEPTTSKFVDTNERYHFYYPDPEKGYYTVGALFMERKK